MTQELMKFEGKIVEYDEYRAQLATLAEGNSKAVFDYRDPKGNKEARSHVYKLRQTKGAVERKRVELKADILVKGRLIDSEAKEITAVVESMIEVHETPIKQIEQEEAARIKGHRDKIALIEGNLDACYQAMHSGFIATCLSDLEAIEPDESFEEFTAEAISAYKKAHAYLSECHTKAAQREAEAAELERLRKEAAERERIERETRIAAEAKAKAEADAKSAAEKREREIAEQQAKAKADADRKEREAAEAIAKAERDKQEAIAKAELEKAEAIARAEKEKAESAERERLAAERAETQRLAAIAKAEADARAAEERQRQAVAQAKLEAEEAAQREQARIARIAREQAAAKAEEEKRAANKAHQKRINNEILAAMLETGLVTDEVAKELISRIAKALIPHVSINY
jgi:colicin import membrane protein